MEENLNTSQILITPQNLQSICRICFTVGNLYDTKISTFEDHTIEDLFSSLINVHKLPIIEKYARKIFPQFICHGCLERIISTKLFFNQCYRAQKILVKVQEDFALCQRTSTILSKPIYFYTDINTIITNRCKLKRAESNSQLLQNITINEVTNVSKNDILRQLCVILDRMTMPEQSCDAITHHQMPNMTEEDDTSLENNNDVNENGENQETDDDVISIQNNDYEKIIEDTMMELFDGNVIETDDDESEDDNKEELGIKSRKKYYCKKCNIKFDGMRPFCRHNGVTHPQKYICKICKKEFPNAILLSKHLWTHDIKVECAICHKKVPKNFYHSHLSSHSVLTHPKSTVKKGEKLCPVCGEIVKTAKWGVHIHSHITPKQCKYCPYKSSVITNFKRHVARHTGNKGFLCTHCGKSFIQKSGLAYHLKLHDINSTPLKCKYCPELFNTLYEHRQHLSSTHTVKIDQMKKNENFTKDESHHTALVKSFVCPVCNKVYKQRCYLNQHLVLHNGEAKNSAIISKNNMKFNCKTCNKTFHSKQTLNAHVRLHTEEKPFKCDLCPSSFRLYQYLHKHIKRKHNESTEFSCEICDKTFKSTVSLMEHIQMHLEGPI